MCRKEETERRIFGFTLFRNPIQGFRGALLERLQSDYHTQPASLEVRSLPLADHAGLVFENVICLTLFRPFFNLSSDTS